MVYHGMPRDNDVMCMCGEINPGSPRQNAQCDGDQYRTIITQVRSTQHLHNYILRLHRYKLSKPGLRLGLAPTQCIQGTGKSILLVLKKNSRE